MKLVISPAKSLNYTSELPTKEFTHEISNEIYVRFAPSEPGDGFFDFVPC